MNCIFTPPRIFLHKLLGATVGVAVFACLFCPALRVQAASSDEGKNAQISREEGAKFTLERTTFFSESGLPTQSTIALPGIRTGEGYRALRQQLCQPVAGLECSTTRARRCSVGASG